MVEGSTSLLARVSGLAAGVVVVSLTVASGAVGGVRQGVIVSSARSSALGEIHILVSANGRTLYDSALGTKVLTACVGVCATEWVPLLVPATSEPRAGTGVSSMLLGRIKRPDGRWQVTYHGSPLFLFSGDKRAGEVNGQSLGGMWHALTPAGLTVTKPIETTSGSTGSDAGSQGSSSTSGSSTTTSGSSVGFGSSAGAGKWCAASPSSCFNG